MASSPTAVLATAPAPVEATSSLPTTTGAPAPTGKPALPALTGLRTLLALNIVFFHFTPPGPRFLYPVFNSSFVFVGFFFLLSGFVLAYNYADRPHLDIRRFYLARLARLYPVYLLSLAISFRMLQAEWHVRSAHEFWTGALLAPLLLQGWNPALATFWNTVAWTLSAEVALYAAFPYLIRLPWLRRQSSPPTPADTPADTPAPNRHLAARLALILLATWAIGLIPHTLYMLFNPDHLAAEPNRYSYAPWLRTLKYTPLPYLCTFLAGITLARLHSALALSPRQRAWLAGLALASIVVFFSQLVARTPYILLHGGLLVPVFSILVLGLSGEHWIASAFAWRPIVLLGQTTFALYLLHFNTINLIKDTHLTTHLHLSALDPWITYAAALAAAAAATFWLERPARAWILARTLPPSP